MAISLYKTIIHVHVHGEWTTYYTHIYTYRHLTNKAPIGAANFKNKYILVPLVPTLQYICQPQHYSMLVRQYYIHVATYIQNDFEVFDVVLFC